ncbi:MAG: spore coat protein U domain-containing protein [Betaproteobacteria bacterium]|nr:spore coat protein U domain-containing protein [Betaproteobacteria bacterium]
MIHQLIKHLQIKYQHIKYQQIKYLQIIVLGLMSLVSVPSKAMMCMGESAPILVFGAYDPHTREHHDIQTVFQIHCIPAYRGEALNLRVHLSGIDPGLLKMRHVETGESLNFSVYRDPARSQPIDALNDIQMSMPLIVPMTLSIPVYGRIPARQNVSVGSYYLPVSVVLTY